MVINCRLFETKAKDILDASLIHHSEIKNQRPAGHPSEVKPHLPPWFSATCAAARVHRNHFLCFYQHNISSKSKVKFKLANIRCKRVLEAEKLAFANKIRVNHFPETWLSGLLANCQ